jgi:hypothetical protein
MTEATVPYDSDGIGDRIFSIRGQKVILDSDLATIYGVEVRALNQQVNRNRRRFPEDFAFYLTEREWHEAKRLGSQNVILKRGQHRKSLPLVFTEHGAIMAANVLNSNKATEMSVFVVRAFIRMRAALTSTHELVRKLAALEREVKARLDSHDAAIVDVLRRIMDMIALCEGAACQVQDGLREEEGETGMITATANTRVVDLCCGIGGLSVAAREMGMQVVAGAGRQVFGCR